VNSNKGLRFRKPSRIKRSGKTNTKKKSEVSLKNLLVEVPSPNIDLTIDPQQAESAIFKLDLPSDQPTGLM
jgi:hypothetical protein